MRVPYYNELYGFELTAEETLVVKAFHQHVQPGNYLSVYPRIPAEKLEAALARQGLLPLEALLCLINNTPANAPAKDILFTTQAIHWSAVNSEATYHLHYKNMTQCTYSITHAVPGLQLESTLSVDPVFIPLIRVDDFTRQALLRFLQDVVKQNNWPERVTLPPSISGKSNSQLVDLNHATLEELLRLSVISYAMAEKLIEVRETRGPFKCFEEVGQLLALKPHEIERLKSRSVLKQYPGVLPRSQPRIIDY